MNRLLLAVGMMALASSGFAATKPCEELRSEIESKLQAKGASGYSLEVVEKGSAQDAQVVGSCDGGSKDIVYRKGS